MKQVRIDYPVPVEYVRGKLKNAGYEVYLVGGSVRDALMGNPVHDYDLTTNASPEEMKEVFREDFLIPTGEKHGTVTVRKDHMNIEITTYRTEGEYQDHRHPDQVCFTKNLREDLSRRDFTVNAMAYDPDEGVIDLFGGEEDLRKGILRCVGDPEKRFTEDALRILRGLRFMSRFGFKADEKTKEAMDDTKHLMKYLSGERIWNELQGLLEGAYADKTVNENREVIREALNGYEGFTADFTDFPVNAEVRAAYLLNRCDESEIRKTAGRLKVSSKTKKHLLDLWNLWNREDLEHPEEIRYLRVRYDDEVLAEAVSVKLGKHSESMKELERLVSAGMVRSVHELDINGNDLLDMGVPAAKIGKILEELLNDVLNEKIPNKKSALKDTAKEII